MRESSLRLLVALLAAVCAAASADDKFADKPADNAPVDDASVVTNRLGMKLISIPAGQYVRGEMHGDQLRKNHPFSTGSTGAHDARPAHRVKISRGFRIGATEVTVGQFRRFVNESGYETTAESSGKGALAFDGEAEQGIEQFKLNPRCTWRRPGFPQTDDHPVVCVSWKDAVAFCQWLSKKEDAAYRLPTEGEWEFAARAGATTSYLGGDSADTIYAYGNVADAALEAAHPGMTRRQRIARLGKGEGDGHVYTAPVASLKPNRRGLFDTHGNVWEWCADKYHVGYYAELTGATVMANDPSRLPLAVDPQGPETTLHHQYGDWRSMRGGAWCTGPISSRCASRSFGEAGDAFCYTGFRVVRED
ncbi:MAG: SUMF1/EgtB/PvdO family nonheme iron enzyme [Pirellulaceae bacterium]